MTPSDRTTIRDLAREVADVASQQIQDEKRRLWTAQNALLPERPLVFISPEGAWGELLPTSTLTCEDDDARGLEHGLRMRLYAAEHFRDDQVCDKAFPVGRAVSITGTGFGVEMTPSTTDRGAYAFGAAIKTLDDIERIPMPTVTHDEAETQRRVGYYSDLFGDILDVKVRGGFWWGFGTIDEWFMLRGMTQTFMDMVDDPDFVHAGMRKLIDWKRALMAALEIQGLLSLNNGSDYVGSGGFGYSDQLPGEGFYGGVRTQDLWGFCEAQMLSEVSPAMHEEFALNYQAELMPMFGLMCYGCCEPLHLKLDMLKARIPNLRRVSISPWADKRMSAEKLGRDVIYSWKPNPAYVAGVGFDGEAVRRDIRETIDLAREHGCALEIILKDTHTCSHRPERFDHWAEIAMQEVGAN